MIRKVIIGEEQVSGGRRGAGTKIRRGAGKGDYVI
jgi:hypothetical protein